MIKSIVEKVLIGKFSKYLNGIQYNKLTIEVLGGNFKIENISLNHQFFNSLETPFKVSFSHIGKFALEAPLTKLSSVPVSCTIEDVYIILHQKSHQRIKDIPNEQLLRKYIQQTFNLLLSKVKEGKKEEGMMDRLVKKILDNLKLQINNIHIRFEEANQEMSFGWGATLKSMTLGATDKNWKPVFIERQKIKEEQPLFKCLQIQNFKLYWQSIQKQNQQKFLFLKQKADLNKIIGMKSMINGEEDAIFCINSQIKLQINPSSHFNKPLFEMQMSFAPIQIHFEKRKVVEILKFASDCVKYNEIMLKAMIQKRKKKTDKQAQKIYKSLCVEFVSHQLQPDQKKMLAKQYFKELFDKNLIENLYTWSLEYIRVLVQQTRQKQLKKQKKGWFSSAEVELTNQEKKQLHRLINELVDDESKTRPPESKLFIFSISMKSLQFRFSDNDESQKLKNISLAIKEIDTFLIKSHNSSYFNGKFNIQKIQSIIAIQEGSQIQNIILMENLLEKQNLQHLIKIDFKEQMIMGKTNNLNKVLTLSFGKTIFTYRREYMKLFKSFFKLPEIDQQVQNEAINRFQELKKNDDEFHELKQNQNKQQFETTFDCEINIASPSIILPLDAFSCWYLDLGRISMKNKRTEEKDIYPFQLSEMHMRYIKDEHSKSMLAENIIKSKDFFPIIQNINLEIVVEKIKQNQQYFIKVELQNLEMNANKQEYLNFLSLKTFLEGSQSDQINQQKKMLETKALTMKEAILTGKIYQKTKFLQKWKPFTYYLNKTSLKLYESDKELIPSQQLSLRKFQIFKQFQITELECSLSEKSELFQIIQLTSDNESFYFKFQSLKELEIWQKEVGLLKIELKNFQALVLEDEQSLKKRKKKIKAQRQIELTLKLNNLSCNYITEEGEPILNILVKGLIVQHESKEKRSRSSLQIGQLQIIDKVFVYANKSYQSLMGCKKVMVKITKNQGNLLKITPLMVSLSVQHLHLNWKPDVLLPVIEFVKEALQIKTLYQKQENNRNQIIQSTLISPHLKQDIQTYQDASFEKKVKNKRYNYLKLNIKEQSVYLIVNAQIEQLTIQFIHRQSHMPMFFVKTKDLQNTISIGEEQKYVEGSAEHFQIYETMGYPQKTYDINKDYEHYCILEKKKVGLKNKIISYKFASYEPLTIANAQRIQSFLEIKLSPVKITYFQQVFMRLIDYFFIQINLLITKPQMLTANENIVEQLKKNEASMLKEKPKLFFQEDLENVVKRFLNPLFMDYRIQFEQPELILLPQKRSKAYFTVNFNKIEITNNQYICKSRFDSKFVYANSIYEEEIEITGKEGRMNIVDNFLEEPFTKNFQFQMKVKRILLEDELNQIFPDEHRYDRSFQITNKITNLIIPSLTKQNYQNLVRLPNFNFNFEDQNDQLFIHNYRITKILSPKPIFYEFNVQNIVLNAQHLSKTKTMLRLMSINFYDFHLIYNRKQSLQSTVIISCREAAINGYQYEEFQLYPKQFNLITLIKNQEKNVLDRNVTITVKMKPKGAMEIMANIHEAQINLQFAQFNLITEWMIVDDSAFPTSAKINEEITFKIDINKAVLNWEEDNQFNWKHQKKRILKMKGSLEIDAVRHKDYSESWLRSALKNKTIDMKEINLPKCLTFQVDLNFQFFNSIDGKQRKILDKVDIIFQERSYLRCKEESVEKAVARSINIGQAKGIIALDDLILIRGLLQRKVQSQKYVQLYLSKLYTSSTIQGEQQIDFQEVQAIPQQNFCEEFIFKIQSLNISLINKEKQQFIPLAKIKLSNWRLSSCDNHKQQILQGNGTIQIFYFNDAIFRWEPVVEKIELSLLSVAVNQNRQKVDDKELKTVGSIESATPLFINVSKEMLISVKRTLKILNEKLEKSQAGQFIAEESGELKSCYVIQNETGYPIQIYDQQQSMQYIIINGDEINYQYDAKDNNFIDLQDIDSNRNFGFKILHDRYDLMMVTGLLLNSYESFSISLMTTNNKAIPESDNLFIENKIKGWRKYITIRSKKCILDYSQNILKTKYLPFDQQDSVLFDEGVHKGQKCSLSRLIEAPNFIFSGSHGKLTIRKKYLVYNYTLIPLQICNLMVIPGEFVGVSTEITIQGVPLKRSLFKYVLNERTSEYYIYSLSYIVDYTGLSFYFNSEHKIAELYSYSFTEGGRSVRIYVLPDIKEQFIIKRSKESSKVSLKGLIGRENFQIQQQGSTHLYCSFGFLESFCEKQIKDFRKIVQITCAVMLINSTDFNIKVKQIQINQDQAITFKSGQAKQFYWQKSNNKKRIQVSIDEADEVWGYSVALPIDKNIETFIVRNIVNHNKMHILALQIEVKDNMTIVHILDSSKRYSIVSQVPGIKIIAYQTAIFEGQQFFNGGFDPTVYTVNAGYKDEKPFGYELPLSNHHVQVSFELDPQMYKGLSIQPFQLNDMENNIFDKALDVYNQKHEKQKKITFYLSLNFSGKNKVLKIFKKKKKIFNKNSKGYEYTIHLNTIYLSVIGAQDKIRKQMLSLILNGFKLGISGDSELIEYNLVLRELKIENSLKADPYFISLLCQEKSLNNDQKRNYAVNFILRRSVVNENLINYVGFSFNKSIITVTSEELEVLEENLTAIMSSLNQKSDTNCLINMEKKFKIEKLQIYQNLYFLEAEIHPLKFIVTFKHVNNWGGFLLKALSINQCGIGVDGKKITHYSQKNLSTFLTKVGNHFTDGVEGEIFSMIGSLAILGSPLRLAEKISGGFKDLILLPAEGFEYGILGVGKGVAMGAGSLIKNTFEGAFGVVESITGSIGNGVSTFASYDKDFSKTRQEIKNQKVDHVGEGLLSGGKSILHGIATGITGLVTEPIKGAEKSGIGGFFMGGLKGLTGLIVKPVSGVIDATSKTAEGIKNTTKVFSSESKERRIRLKNPGPLYGLCRQIRYYEPKAAFWNQRISLKQEKYENLNWSGTYAVSKFQTAILTYEYILIVSEEEKQIKLELKSQNIKNFEEENPFRLVLIVAYQSEKKRFAIECEQPHKCLNEVKKIFKYHNPNYELINEGKQTKK